MAKSETPGTIAKAQTLAAWRKDSQAISEVFANAEKLLRPLSAELDYSRVLLERLKNYIHPELRGYEDYVFKISGSNQHMRLHDAINARVTAINALLGDRT